MRAIANLDRALRELIYLFFFYLQTNTTHNPRPAYPRPTTHDPPTHDPPTHDPRLPYPRPTHPRDLASPSFSFSRLFFLPLSLSVTVTYFCLNIHSPKKAFCSFVCPIKWRFFSTNTDRARNEPLPGALLEFHAFSNQSWSLPIVAMVNFCNHILKLAAPLTLLAPQALVIGIP